MFSLYYTDQLQDQTFLCLISELRVGVTSAAADAGNTVRCSGCIHDLRLLEQIRPSSAQISQG